MPVYTRKVPTGIREPWDSEDSADEERVDPDLLHDSLPQPFRMVGKVLDGVLERAWDVISDREAAKVTQRSRRKIPQVEFSDEVTVGISLISVIWNIFPVTFWYKNTKSMSCHVSLDLKYFGLFKWIKVTSCKQTFCSHVASSESELSGMHGWWEVRICGIFLWDLCDQCRRSRAYCHVGAGQGWNHLHSLHLSWRDGLSHSYCGRHG